jgi:hypothetical protein
VEEKKQKRGVVVEIVGTETVTTVAKAGRNDLKL